MGEPLVVTGASAGTGRAAAADPERRGHTGGGGNGRATNPMTATAARATAAAQAVLGALLVASPRLLMRAIAPAPLPVRPARLLGTRMLVQGLVEWRRPTRGTLQVGVAIDAIHAVTMLGLARRSGRYRRVALSSAAVATGFGVCLAAASRHCP